MGSIALISPCIPVIVEAEEAEEDDDEDELVDEDPPPPQLIKNKIVKKYKTFIIPPKNIF